MEANYTCGGKIKLLGLLGNLGDIIIIIGGICVAIKNISEYFGKPIKFFKKRTDKNFEAKTIEILNKVLPDILYQHDLGTRDKYLADRQRYLEDIKAEVLKNIQGELNEVAQLASQYEVLVISSKDVLREKIMAIYHKNKKDKTLTLNEKEALDQYYVDYKSMKGNSYIDKYYNRMKKWKVAEDDYNDDDDAL